MPIIKLENCTKCLKCVKDCPSRAIDIEKGTINDTCIHCGHCVAICPEATVFPDEGEVKKLHSSTISAEDFQNLSAEVRTCRSFLDKEVDEATLTILVENMKHYPSASNARPLQITIVRTPELIQSLNDQTADKIISKLKFITSPLLAPFLRILAPAFDRPKLFYYRKRFMERRVPGASQICHHAPAIILFHAPVNKYGMAGADANIWATYTSLYAYTLGLGTCFNGFIVQVMARSKALRKQFQIPDNHRVYETLLIGHPKVKYKNEAGRTQPEVKFI